MAPVLYGQSRSVNNFVYLSWPLYGTVVSHLHWDRFFAFQVLPGVTSTSRISLLCEEPRNKGPSYATDPLKFVGRDCFSTRLQKQDGRSTWFSRLEPRQQSITSSSTSSTETWVRRGCEIWAPDVRRTTRNGNEENRNFFYRSPETTVCWIME